jgi:predicted RNase H-like HicB family nuclease
MVMSGEPVQLTAVIEREDDWFVATCPKLDIVSQGETVEAARSNLLEAVEGFFEVASPSEIKRRLKKETYHAAHAGYPSQTSGKSVTYLSYVCFLAGRQAKFWGRMALCQFARRAVTSSCRSGSEIRPLSFPCQITPN